MEQRQLRLLALLAVVLLGLVAVYRFWEPEEEPLDPDETALVWEVAQDAITRVVVTREEGRVVLERDGEDWRVVEPEAYPADELFVAGLLADLARIERGVPMEGEPDRFGLAPTPVATVEVTEEGGEPKTLEVGNAAPVGYRTYARGPSGQVVAVTGDLPKKLTKGVDAFRGKELFRFDPADVRAVTVTTAEGVLEVYERDGDWWLTDFTRADADKVDDLVMGLKDLRFDNFLSDEAVGGGIAEPLAEVVVTLEGDEAQRARVGEPNPMGQLVEVRGDHVDGVVAGTVFPQSLALLGQGPVDIGDRRAFPFRRSHLAGAEVTVGDASSALAKNADGRWELAGETGERPHALLEALEEATISYRREPVPALEQTWGTVVLTDDEGAQRTIEIGQREGPRWRVARDLAGGEPYLVPVGELEAIAAEL